MGFEDGDKPTKKRAEIVVDKYMNLAAIVGTHFGGNELSELTRSFDQNTLKKLSIALKYLIRFREAIEKIVEEYPTLNEPKGIKTQVIKNFEDESKIDIEREKSETRAEKLISGRVNLGRLKKRKAAVDKVLTTLKSMTPEQKAEQKKRKEEEERKRKEEEERIQREEEERTQREKEEERIQREEEEKKRKEEEERKRKGEEERIQREKEERERKEEEERKRKEEEKRKRKEEEKGKQKEEEERDTERRGREGEDQGVCE